jgi:hypothetical protein
MWKKKSIFSDQLLGPYSTEGEEETINALMPDTNNATRQQQGSQNLCEPIG